MGGVGHVRRKGKERKGCFLDDVGAFGINADQWTAAAQDERNVEITGILILVMSLFDCCLYIDIQLFSIPFERSS